MNQINLTLIPLIEHVAYWNRRNDSEKAQCLIMCLRGSDQKILSELTYHQCINYITPPQIQSEREREELVVSLETEKREIGETIAQYGYSLKKVAQRAFPNEPSLEMNIIDQYLNGLGWGIMSLRNT